LRHRRYPPPPVSRKLPILPADGFDAGALAGEKLLIDKFRDECGVFGVYGHPEAANLAYLGIHALQHRGQESAGIASFDGRTIHVHKAMGLVADIFDQEAIASLPGAVAIGHTRYSTAGSSNLANAQPMLARSTFGQVAVAHNGNLVNAEELRMELAKRGALFHGTSDTEVIVHLLAHEPETKEIGQRIRGALSQVRGAYSVLFLTEEGIVAVRDPLGFRPLVIGRLKNGAPVFASETCALDLIEATYVRDVEPGEMVIADEKGVRTLQTLPKQRSGNCIFELVYFARPDSQVFGRSVYATRKAFGRRLAKEAPVEADVVVPVPDSGVPAALGFSEASGIPYDLGLIRSHYVGRTFIEPSQSIRHFGVKLKLNPVPQVVKGKRVVVVDDSIVRGTTSRKIVKMIRDAGATEVHLRISAPPTRWPCYYGIDTPVRSELIASSHTEAEIAKYVTADSLGYLSRDGMHEAAKAEPRSFCDACFTGEYLVQLTPLESGARPAALGEVHSPGGEHAPREGKATGAAENLKVVHA
jgi:amidophosphoribosyltransferase